MGSSLGDWTFWLIGIDTLKLSLRQIADWFQSQRLCFFNYLVFFSHFISSLDSKVSLMEEYFSRYSLYMLPYYGVFSRESINSVYMMIVCYSIDLWNDDSSQVWSKHFDHDWGRSVWKDVSRSPWDCWRMYKDIRGFIHPSSCPRIAVLRRNKWFVENGSTRHAWRSDTPRMLSELW